MIVPSERSKHIISICKGQHEQKDTLQALRNFVSNWCGIEPEQVSGATMYKFLLDAMSEISDKHNLIHFIEDIFRFETSVGYEAVMRQMASAIAITSVRDHNGTPLIDLSMEQTLLS